MDNEGKEVEKLDKGVNYNNIYGWIADQVPQHVFAKSSELYCIQQATDENWGGGRGDDVYM